MLTRGQADVLNVIALVLARGGVEGGVRQLKGRVAGVKWLLEDDLQGPAVAGGGLLGMERGTRAWKGEGVRICCVSLERREQPIGALGASTLKRASVLI